MSVAAEHIVVGAGPAGAALATLLARSGRDVLLLDKADFPRDKTCGDALSPRAFAVLRALGLMPAVLAAGHRLEKVRLHAPSGVAIETRIPPFRDLPRAVCVVPRVVLDEIVRSSAVDAGVRFLPKRTVTALLRDGDRVVGVRATTESGEEEWRATTVTLACGAATGLLERERLLRRPPLLGLAARSYWTEIVDRGAVEFYFDGVPLPGYGWVFPLGGGRANVGAGYLARGRRAPSGSARAVYEQFVASRSAQGQLAGGRSQSAAKGFPLRFDFHRVRHAWPGLHLIGEAAGLCNPLTGEGIDYALESAETAAEALLGGPPDPGQRARQHAAALRSRFAGSFRATSWVRDLYLRRWVLDRFATVATRHADLAELFVAIALGHLHPKIALSPGFLGRVAVGI